MSYILDALRKADAQRERDPARGIYAQPVTALPLERDAEPANPFILLAWAGCAALVLALAAWWLAQPGAPAEAPAALPAAASAPVSPSPSLAAAPAPAPATPPPAPATALLPPAPPLRPAPAPPVAVLPPSVESQPRTPAPSQPAAVAGERLLTLGDLPPDVQRDLPKINITGGVYSTEPARRLLIVNGLVLNEGAEAAPGVLLAQIRPKVAVLTFRGWRYGVAY